MKKGILFLLTTSLLALTACSGKNTVPAETEAQETSSADDAASAQEASMLAELGDDWEYIVNPDGFSARLGKDKIMITAEADPEDLYAEDNDRFNIQVDQYATGFVAEITNVKTTKAYTIWLAAGESIQSLLDSDDFGSRLVGISDSTFELKLKLWAASGAVYNGTNVPRSELSQPVVQMINSFEETENTGSFIKVPFEDRECLGDHIALIWDINNIDRKTISTIGKEIEQDDEYDSYDDDSYSGGGYYYFDPVYGYVWIEEETEEETETEPETEAPETETVRHDHYMVYTPKDKVDVYWWVTSDHSIRREEDDVNCLYYVEGLGVSFKHKLTQQNAFDLTEDTITIYRDHVGKNIQELYDKNMEEYY